MKHRMWSAPIHDVHHVHDLHEICTVKQCTSCNETVVGITTHIDNEKYQSDISLLEPLVPPSNSYLVRAPQHLFGKHRSKFAILFKGFQNTPFSNSSLEWELVLGSCQVPKIGWSKNDTYRFPKKIPTNPSGWMKHCKLIPCLMRWNRTLRQQHPETDRLNY